MGQIAIAALKGSLSEQLRRVKAGEVLTVTERGIPIARIVPIPAASGDLDSLRDLVSKGLATLPRSALPADFCDALIDRPPTGALAAVLAEREDGW